MAYAQINYSQHLGNSPTVTISEAGCLLTAICNGLLKFNGNAPDPASLNNWFEARSLYLYDTADHASDDLASDSITKYDPTIILSDSGNSAVPSSDNAVVKFHYNSVHSGQPIDHYCWVDHVQNEQVYIIDSWDGVVKSPAMYEHVYHLPVSWFAYVKNNPAPAAPPPPPAPRYQVTESYTPAKQIKLNQQPTYLWGMNYDFATMVKNPVETHNQGEICEVTNKVHHEDGSNYYRRDGQVDGFNVVDCDDYTPPPPPAAPVPFTASEKYQLDWAVPRYAIAADAMNKQNVVDTLSPSNGYFVYSRDLGMVNVTDDNQKNKQWWINPAQNVPPVPVAVPQPVVAQTTPIQVTTVPAPLTSVLRNPADWRTTLSAYNLLREPERFISINTTTIDIQDLEGKHEPIQLLPHTKVDAIATFEKDGILYARPQACFLPDNKYFGSWYGIPTRVLKADAIYNRAGAILDRLSLGNSRFGDRLISDFVRVRQTIDGILAKRKVK